MFEVCAHGTSLPFFAFLWHNGPGLPSALPYPHDHWHPKPRFAVRFQSIYDDLEYLNEVCLLFGNECRVNAGAGLTCTPDGAAQQDLPYKSKRTGADCIVPSYLSRYEDVDVLRSEDDGPLTKLYLNVMLSWCLLI